MRTDLKESIEAQSREHAEKERIAAELNVAAEIQASMLPCIFPPFPDRPEFDIFASMLPAKEIGGDFYDFHLIDNNNLVIVIADVSGKGIPAALFMVITKTLIRNCTTCKSPKGVFEIVNNKLCQNNEANMFVTALMGYYNIPSGKFVYANAGHNPPLVKKSGKGYEFLRKKPCIVLGFLENAQYSEEEIILEPGEAIFLYTDGVTEALNAKGEFYTEPRLFEALKKHKDCPPRELLSVIKQDIDNFAGGAEQADDITMLALEVSRYDSLSHPVMKELILDADRNRLNEVIDFVNAELENSNCPPEQQGQIDVAVEEIFENIANYAYKPETGKATIGIAAGAEILLKFEDSGRPYNPLEKTAPDLDKPLMDREIGGLGIFLVQKLMDTIRYERVDNKNVLTVSKKVK
jgi:sigma-B regulation protein RsbU (phosphoserine phosphatase)